MLFNIRSGRPLRFVYINVLRNHACTYKATCEDELTFAVRNEFMEFLLRLFAKFMNVCRCSDSTDWIQMRRGRIEATEQPLLLSLFLRPEHITTFFVHKPVLSWECANAAAKSRPVRGIKRHRFLMACTLRRWQPPECKWIRFQYKIKNGPRCVLVGCWPRLASTLCVGPEEREMNNSWWWLEPPCCILRAQWLGMAITMDKKRMLCWHLTDGCEIITQKAPPREEAGAARTENSPFLIFWNVTFLSPDALCHCHCHCRLSFFLAFHIWIISQISPCARGAKLMAAERVERKTR